MHGRSCPPWSWTYAGVAVLALVTSTNLNAQALQIGTLRIESVPAGAKVELIGGNAGSTPLTVSERDIYPNSYPDARADLYGTITLRHPGCEPLRHRVTLNDLKQDLHLRLDCVATAAAVAAPPVSPASASSTAKLAPTTPDAMSQRRLRQLQVIQELLDEGLINPAEEQRVRRRILQLDVPAER